MKKFPLSAFKFSWHHLSLALLALCIFLPVVSLFVLSAEMQDQYWQHIWGSVISSLVPNTLFLLLGVGSGTFLLGVGLAWLITHYQFRGKKIFDWALVLPLAVPTYVMAFVQVGIWDYTGPVATQFRIWELQIPEIRSTWGVILVLSFCLYPYVYLMARTGFRTQGQEYRNVAASLGLNSWQSFWRVSVPMARPWIVAGLSFALMETIADFGAVSIFNYDTFTTAIYKSWFGFFSISGAARLALLLLIFALILIFLEKYQSRAKKYNWIGNSKIESRSIELSPLKSALASLLCFSVVGFAFLLPLVQLFYWLLSSSEVLSETNYWQYIFNTLILASVAAISIGLICFYISLVEKRRSHIRLVRFLAPFWSMGYAIPGSVLAVAVFIAIKYVDQVLSFLQPAGIKIVLGSSVFALFIAYGIRFMTLGHQTIGAAMGKINNEVENAARSLEPKKIRIFKKIYWPLLNRPILVAVILIFIEILKEMPITILCRPFGWDTLSVKIFQWTSEGEWERAALPAILLIVIGLFPVLVVTKIIEENSYANNG